MDMSTLLPQIAGVGLERFHEVRVEIRKSRKQLKQLHLAPGAEGQPLYRTAHTMIGTSDQPAGEVLHEHARSVFGYVDHCHGERHGVVGIFSIAPRVSL
jgi:hypothetical protein